ncbi:MAG: hypothetical protein FJ320_06190 [SAR202 cluster bacterium]|nr:hypothetical protein [SAR202 cluster bacterium]
MAVLCATRQSISGIPSPGPFPDCIGTEYSLLEGEEKIRITSSPSFGILRTASNSLFSFAIGEEGEPEERGDRDMVVAGFWLARLGRLFW